MYIFIHIYIHLYIYLAPAVMETRMVTNDNSNSSRLTQNEPVDSTIMSVYVCICAGLFPLVSALITEDRPCVCVCLNVCVFARVPTDSILSLVFAGAEGGGARGVFVW